MKQLGVLATPSEWAASHRVPSMKQLGVLVTPSEWAASHRVPSMKQLGVSLLLQDGTLVHHREPSIGLLLVLLDGILVHHKFTPGHFFRFPYITDTGTHLYTWME